MLRRFVLDLDSLLKTFVQYDKNPKSLIPSDMHVADSVNISEVAEEIRNIYVYEGKGMQDNLGRSLGVSVISSVFNIL